MMITVPLAGAGVATTAGGGAATTAGPVATAAGGGLTMVTRSLRPHAATDAAIINTVVPMTIGLRIDNSFFRSEAQENAPLAFLHLEITRCKNEGSDDEEHASIKPWLEQSA